MSIHIYTEFIKYNYFLFLSSPKDTCIDTLERGGGGERERERIIDQLPLVSTPTWH